ncbi:MAG: DUF2066 domain-containing protein [Succinivibrionaceae bacterium]|nr:DUF2066 domain-containing protein [Succinivibrionaceae bacterium]
MGLMRFLHLSLCLLGAAQGVVAAQVSYEQDLRQGVDRALSMALAAAVSDQALEVPPALRLDMVEGILSGVSLAENGLAARFAFDGERLKSLVEDLGGHAFTGLERPILVWMVEHSERESVLVGSNALSMFASHLGAAAEGLGYKLMFPLLDLEDVQKVSVEGVLSHQDAILALASQRYAPDYFLACAVEEGSEGVIFKWNLYDKGGKRLGGADLRGNSAEIARGGAQDIARSINAAEGPRLEANAGGAQALGPGQGCLRLKFANVMSLDDFLGLRAQLVTYGYGRNARIVGYAQDGVVVEIPTEGDAVGLTSTLEQSAAFEKVGDYFFSCRKSSGLPKDQLPSMGPRDPQRVSSSLAMHKAVAVAAEFQR